MPLAAGTRLGPYEIVAPLGKGGMGEVYRARDTKLGREVAIKVLPEEFANDVERLARFEREAKLLASLNHPNIAGIHGLEESGGVKALVLELVEGPTLAERIANGPIPVEEALPIAKQIAEALEAGHEAGIIHRDLKPANIKLKEDGTTKVLDYGLAKALERDAPSGGSAELSQSPTLTRQGTQAGVILGTAPYMSPEQAKGKRVDKRADIWAFGAVVYEMLTGRRAYPGEDVTDTIVSVVSREPDWHVLPATTPASLRRLLARSLEKDPKTRLRDIGEARVVLDELMRGEPDEVEGSAANAAPRFRALSWALAASAAIFALLWVTAWAPWRPAPAAPLRTRLLTAGPAGIAPRDITALAVSPDGRTVAFVAPAPGDTGLPELWLWPLDSLDAKPLAGTSDARSVAWSPDGRSLAFVAGNDLRRVDVAGGPPQTVLADEISSDFGVRLAWGRDGELLFTDNVGISKVPASGGTATPLARPKNPGARLDLPVPLPDGRHFLYLSPFIIDQGVRIVQSEPGIYVGALDEGPDQQPARRVVDATDGPVLVHDPGSMETTLVFRRDDDLLAQAFDIDRLAVVGNAVPVATGVGGDESNHLLSASADGAVLLYRTGGGEASHRILVWVNRQGREEPLPVPPRSFRYAQLSPDGTEIALDIRDGDSPDIWIWNFAQQGLRRFTLGRNDERAPAWSPDGERIAFTVVDGPETTVFWQAADGSGAREVLVEPKPGGQFPTSFSPDGATLLYDELDGFPAVTHTAIWSIAVRGSGRSGKALSTGDHRWRNAAISPDGRWMAYQSNESGQDEVHVRPFPATESGHWQISTNGGTHPRWSRDGRELFYFDWGGRNDPFMMAVPIDARASFGFGRATPLFRSTYVVAAGLRQAYDVSADGQRFLMIKSATEAGGAESMGLVVLQHGLDGILTRN